MPRKRVKAEIGQVVTFRLQPEALEGAREIAGVLGVTPPDVYRVAMGIGVRMLEQMFFPRRFFSPDQLKQTFRVMAESGVSVPIPSIGAENMSEEEVKNFVEVLEREDLLEPFMRLSELALSQGLFAQPEAENNETTT